MTGEFGIHEQQIEFYIGISLGKCLEHRGQAMDAHMVAGRHAEFAANGGRERANLIG